jgi:hypothetical protein
VRIVFSGVTPARIIRGGIRGDTAMRRGVACARGNESSLRRRIGRRAFDDGFERADVDAPILAGFAAVGATIELPYQGLPP